MNTDRVILITGASSGMGRVTADYLASKGYKVYGVARSFKRLKERSEQCDTSGSFEEIYMDVTDEQSIREVIDYIVKKDGKIDILFNNAGMGIAGAIEDTSIEEAKQIFEINFFGMLRVCKQVLPIMREQKQGYIINTSSIMGVMGLPFQGFYSATKYAIEGFTETLRYETKEFGIKAVLIEPGDFATGFTANRKRTGNSSNSIYSGKFEKNMDIIEKDENNGCNPIVFAKLVEGIINNPSPKVRYLVGYKVQKLAVKLKKILPQKTFEKMIMGFYKF